MAFYKCDQFKISYPETAVTLVELLETIGIGSGVNTMTSNIEEKLTDIGIDYTVLTIDDFVVYVTKVRGNHGGGDSTYWGGSTNTPYISAYDNTTGNITISGLMGTQSGNSPGHSYADSFKLFLKLYR